MMLEFWKPFLVVLIVIVFFWGVIRSCLGGL